MMGTAGMKNAGLVVLAVAVLAMGWRLAEVTREKTSIEGQARTRSGELQVRLKASGDALEQVQSARDIAVERVQELEAELAQGQAGRAAAVEAKEALFAKYSVLENALAKRRADDKQREGKIQALRADFARLRATHEELARERDRLVAERDRFASELQSARSISSAEHARLATELSKAHTRADQLVAERDDSREKLEAVTVEREELRTRAIELESADVGTRDELARARKSLAKERNEAAALSVRLTHERTEKSRIEQESRALLAKFDTIDRERSDLRPELEAMAHERRRLALRLNELEGTTVALRQTASATVGELGRAQSIAADLNMRYEKLLTEKAKLNHLNEAQLTEIERIRVALEDAQSDVARLTSAHGIYTVKEGDSLSIVAAFFYANGNYWPRIAEANRFLIGDSSDLIFAGMVLIIP